MVRALHRVLVFSKPAVPGRVKTRLIGDLTAAEAAKLHQAFLEDVVTALRRGSFELQLAWALEGDEAVPALDPPLVGFPQRGADLGERLFHGLSDLAGGDPRARLAAVGSDHPEITARSVQAAFEKLEAGADVVVGPSDDGGYYLIATTLNGLDRELFDGIDWSTARVLDQTRSRCRARGWTYDEVEPGHDIDTTDDLAALKDRLARNPELVCAATRSLLKSWTRPAS